MGLLKSLPFGKKTQPETNEAIKDNVIQIHPKRRSDTPRNDQDDASDTLSDSAASSATLSSLDKIAIQKSDTLVFAKSLDRHGILLETLYEQCSRLGFMRSRASGKHGNMNNGAVYLRTGKDDYRVYPHSVETSIFAKAVSALRPEAAIEMHSVAISSILNKCDESVVVVPVKKDVRIQVVDTMLEVARARKSQSCAFVRESDCLVMWTEEPMALVELAERLQTDLLEFIWAGGNSLVREAALREQHNLEKSSADLESGPGDQSSDRKVILIQPFIICFSMMLVLTFVGFIIRSLLVECLTDHIYYRVALLIFVPWTVFASMFFCNAVCGNLVLLFGPINQVKTNSKYYSCTPPERIGENFPHITIQAPVYKESLAGVIDPTMRSLRRAIQTYELQGGTASVFVNDDGMQLLDPESQDIRRQYYRDNNIGWVARPPHGKDGYIRAGRFKKASNMNFCLNVSLRVEKLLESAERSDDWTIEDEEALYRKTLQQICSEDSRVWADGNIRVGDIILLVDSDTRVPEDCLLDAASEFYHSPELGILQHSSSVMQVVHNYWENMITFFTDLVYHSIRLATASGDVAAFVGHNAFLRWTAIQEAATLREEDNFTVFWSESHVSEDFELSLKMHALGYHVRYAVYTMGEFKEGVSLTVYDEFTRWEKYAYGCSELLLHPFKDWIFKGPVTPIFRSLVRSKLPGFSKWSMMSYIGTYFAMGSSWILSLVNFGIVGFYSESVDKLYLNSWEVMLSVIVVFGGFSSLLFIWTQFRINDHPFLQTLGRTLFYIIPLSMFFTSLSFHISMSLLAHLFSVNVQWGATAKELDDSNFFKEVPKIFKSYKYMYIIISALLIAVIIVQTPVMPYHFQVDNFSGVFPLYWVYACHLVVPFILNPQIMVSMILSIGIDGLTLQKFTF